MDGRATDGWSVSSHLTWTITNCTAVSPGTTCRYMQNQLQNKTDYKTHANNYKTQPITNCTNSNHPNNKSIQHQLNSIQHFHQTQFKLNFITHVQSNSTNYSLSVVSDLFNVTSQTCAGVCETCAESACLQIITEVPKDLIWSWWRWYLWNVSNLAQICEPI